MRSVAILAGGRATRFGGRDKSALLVGGRSMLDRQLGELASLSDDLMIVAGADDARSRLDAALDDVDPARRAGNPPQALRAQALGARLVHDIVPGCGPLGGLHAALTAARGDPVLVVACDMPFVTAAFAAFLFSLASEGHVIVPRTERGYHPLCALYARACLEPVAAHLAERRLALRDLLSAVPTRVVTEEEMRRFGVPSRLLANVNTPAEYADLEALQGHKP
jgi:molybdopterin-guanine dinucleotide biosynthesis protein A